MANNPDDDEEIIEIWEDFRDRIRPPVPLPPAAPVTIPDLAPKRASGADVTDEDFRHRVGRRVVSRLRRRQ